MKIFCTIVHLLCFLNLIQSSRIDVKTSKLSYNGYISENIRVSGSGDDGETDGDTTTTTAAAGVYIRFIDYEKPALLLVQYNNQITCDLLMNKLNIRIQSGNEDDYFEDPFVDTETFLTDNQIKCNLELKLKPNRDQLNREAKDVYSLSIAMSSDDSELTLLNSNFDIIVQILDDNDNDPLFDKYEYQFDMSDLQYLPAWSIIGAVKSFDADFARNSEINYFLSGYNPLFGCIKHTGEIYLKYDTRYLFSNYARYKEYFKFEAKSIDNGPKLDFYDYLVENQTTKAFKQQYLDATAITINLNQVGLSEIESSMKVSMLYDASSIRISLSSNIDAAYFDKNFHVTLNQATGVNLIKLSIDRLSGSGGDYSLRYEAVDVQSLLQSLPQGVNITFSIDVCLKANQFCVQKFIYSQNLKQLFNNLCKFELKMQAGEHLGANMYRIRGEQQSVGDYIGKLSYELSETHEIPYYFSMNLCKYAQIKHSGFRFEYAVSNTTLVTSQDGFLLLKGEAKSVNFGVLVKNVDDIVDDFYVNITYESLNSTYVSPKRVSTLRQVKNSVQIMVSNGLLAQNEVIYDLKSTQCRIETERSLFRIKSNLLLAAFSYRFSLNDFLMNKTQKISLKIQCMSEMIDLSINLVPLGIPYNLPAPYLDSYMFTMSDMSIKIKIYNFLDEFYKLAYKFQTLSGQDYDQLPFKYDINTQQLFYLNKSDITEHKFKLLFTITYKSVEYSLPTQINFKLKQPADENSTRLAELKCDTSTIQTINFLNIPKWSTYLQLYGKSQLLGFIRLKGSQQSLTYELVNITHGYNQSLFELNSQNGALYLNDENLTLLKRQYQQQKLNINLFVRVNASSDSKLCRVRIRVQATNSSAQLLDHHISGEQKFYTNTNNMLNFLYKGNEFVVRNLRISENMPENSVVLNLNEYIRQNFNLKKFYYFDSVQSNLNFTLLDDRYFRIESLSSNLVSRYQLNYESKQSYFVQIRIEQYLNQYEIDDVDNQVYVYFLDLRIIVDNEFDEQLSTKWPIYYKTFDLVTLSESQEDEIPLFQVPLVDYEQNSTELGYKCSIMTKSLRYLFHSTENLTIAIDRASLAHVKVNSEYEIDVKISDSYDRVGRFKLIITFNDAQNEGDIVDGDDSGDDEVELDPETKPIVNDINLNSYDHIFDTSKPLTQIIVFNLDPKSTYTFQLTRVQIQMANKKHQQSFNKTFLNKLFHIEEKNGYVYARQSQLPCSNCTLAITYRINKTTPVIRRSDYQQAAQAGTGGAGSGGSDYYDYNSPDMLSPDDGEGVKVTTKRGMVKLQVSKLAEDVIKKLPIKTFSLALNETIYLNRNLKLGEKLTEIRINRDVGLTSTTPAAITNFFLLNNEDLSKQIFYLSNHDGSLYLIKKLNFNLRQTVVFNLTMQITNSLGQYEMHSLNVCLNNKRPQFNIQEHEEQKFEFNLDLTSLNREYVSKSLALKQAINTELEDNVYKIDNCYYFSTAIQIAKNFTSSLKYPLCGYLELDRKTASLELKMDSIVKFLLKSSDVLISSQVKTMVYMIDYSVFNSLSLKSDITRVEIKINFNQLMVPASRPVAVASVMNTQPAVEMTFRRSEYYIKLSTFDVGMTIMDLSGEVQIVNQTFKPFELNFTMSSSTQMVDIVSSFGILYVKSVVTNPSFIQVTVSCSYLSFSASTIVNIEIETQNRAIEWTVGSVNATLLENSPVSSLLMSSGFEILRLTDYLSQDSTPMFSFYDSNMIKSLEIDQFIGTVQIRAKRSENFVFKVVLCKINEFCTLNKPSSILTVNVQIRKQAADESEKVIEVIEARNSIEPIPGLTVYKLRSDLKVNVQVENHIDESIFGIIDVGKGIKEVYLTNYTFRNSASWNILCLALNRVFLRLPVAINMPTQTSIMRKLYETRLTKISESTVLYKFNNLGEIRLLNYGFLFYIANNSLYAHVDRIQDGEYTLHFLQMKTSSRFMVKIDLYRQKSEFYVPHSLLSTPQLNLKKFSMKLNLTIRLDDLLKTNQTQPIVILSRNSNIVRSITVPAIIEELLTRQLFKLDINNGYLYVNKTSLNELDLENLGYLKKISLYIQLDSEPDSMLELNINMETPATPSFKNRIYYYEIIASQNNYFIDNFHRYLLSRGGHVFYDLIEGDDLNQFHLDFQSGDLSLRNSTHLQLQSTYSLIVKVFNLSNNEDSTNLTVFVNFTDIHERESKKELKIDFTQQEYILDLDENVPEMTLVLKLNEKLSKQSFNYPIDYQLENHRDKFYLNESTGYLYTKMPFDYETVEQLNSQLINDTADLIISKEFVLKIVANGQTGCNLRVRIQNLNDNKPQFVPVDTKYRVFLSNFNDENVFVTKLQAYDLDIVARNQNLTYSIIGQHQNIFNIDTVSGNLYLNNKAYKSYEQFSAPNATFNLMILANDSLFSTSISINVQVAETSFVASTEYDTTLYNCTINEDALPGTHVITLNISPVYKYYILNGDLYKQFELNANTGKLYTRLLLDREFVSLYMLDILAVDGQSRIMSKVSITVNDINDNRPICNDSVRIFNASQLTSGHIYAYDADLVTRFRYSLVSEAQLPVKIDRSTGSLRINNNFEPIFSSTQYEFQVRVSDQDGYYCLIKTILHIDDHSVFKATSSGGVEPRFVNSVFMRQVEEHAAKNHLVDVLNITDRSLYGSVQFTLLTDTLLVRLDPKFGYLQINTDNFDREVIGEWLNLTAQVTSVSGISSVCNYYIRVVDLNDNLPQFSDSNEAYMDIEENLAPNTLIYKLNAVDLDENSSVKYKFLTRQDEIYGSYAAKLDDLRDDSKYFDLNEETGELYTKEQLDFEKTEQFVLYFIALDPKFNYSGIDMAELRKTVFKLNIKLIDLNDNRPMFNESLKNRYFLAENCEINTTVGYMNATDLDKNDKIEFSLATPSDYIAIDRHTGRLYTIGDIDYEAHRELKMRIRAENPGSHNSASDFNVTIEIVNLNDNKPLFAPENETLFINENFPLGSQMYKFEIVDKDVINISDYSNYTFLIVKQNLVGEELIELTKPIFSINKNLSLILIDKPIQNQTYMLQIRVYDNENFLLHSDTWLRIHVAQDVETKVISLDVLLIENQYSLLDNQVIYHLNQTSDLNDDLFKVDNSGDLRVDLYNDEIRLSSEYRLKIDKNLVLNVQFRNFYSDCLANLVKLKLNHTKLDYVDELKLMLKLLFNLNTQQQVNILSSSSNSADNTSELLFAITRNTNPTQCYNSKLIKKFLLKNSDYLQNNYRMKIMSVKYVTSCNGSSICLSNTSCKMSFYYNTTRLQCLNETTCVLYPSYKLSCSNIVNLRSKSIQNRCKTANPCLNNGICKQINSKKTKIHCFCPNGYTGKHCENDIDECSLYEPCANSTATCANTNGSFSCNCTSGNDTSCYNYTFEQLYAKLANQADHQSTSISSSLSSIIADSKNFQQNYDLLNNNNDSENRSFFSLLKSKDTLLGIFSGIFIVVFIFILVLLISLFVYKIRTLKKHKQLPESVATNSGTSSNPDIDEIGEEEDEEDDDVEVKAATATSKGFFKRKQKTYSSTSSRKKLVVKSNNTSNHVKLQLLNNEININSVHNTFQREVKFKTSCDASTETTKTLAKNFVMKENNLETAKKIIVDYEKSPKMLHGASTSTESLNKREVVVKLNNNTTTANIISPDYNYEKLYNTNKKINIKKTINNEGGEPEAERDEEEDDERVMLKMTKESKTTVMIEQNNLDKDDTTTINDSNIIVEDCQGFYWDITDWATGISNNNNNNSDSPSTLKSKDTISNELNTNYDKLNEEYAVAAATAAVFCESVPIYSKVRKFKQTRDDDDDDDEFVCQEQDEQDTLALKSFISDLNLNETNSNEDNNYNYDEELTTTSHNNTANNQIYLFNNDINQILSKKSTLNEYLPVYKPVKLLNNILNDSITTTTTTSSSSVSINQQQQQQNTENYDYIYSKYNQYNKGGSNLLQTFKCTSIANDEKQQQRDSYL